MQSKYAEVNPRNFNPMWAPGLSDEARKAVNANNEHVIEKMAAAARALGWPEQIVDATRAQFQSITKLQIQTMDSMMDAWEEQIKSPNPSSAMLSKLKSLPNFGPAGSWPNADALQMAALNPFPVYMQFAEQWQKAWVNAMALWAKAGPRH